MAKAVDRGMDDLPASGWLKRPVENPATIGRRTEMALLPVAEALALAARRRDAAGRRSG